MQDTEFFPTMLGIFLLSLLHFAAHKYITQQWHEIEFKLFSVKLTQANYQSMDIFVAFLAIFEVQCGCMIRTLIKTQQCQW